MKMIDKIYNWAKPKGLIKYENRFKQVLKLSEEVGELASAILKNDKKAIIDAIGDIKIVVSILCFQMDLDEQECLEHAYNEIKNRTGETVNGTFIKDE